ncbi:MAG: hypothetical protein ACW96N_01530 [Candidatus Thorarchaeota archaeon]
MKVILNAGTEAYESVLGHYNFEYPSEKKIAIEQSTFVRKLNWKSTNELVAVIIENTSAIPVEYGRKVVWVLEESLETL